MQQFWKDLLEIHFAVGADASTLYSVLGTVAQTLAATTGFSIAFVLMRFPAIESQLKAIDDMLGGAREAISKNVAWAYLLRENGTEQLYKHLHLAPCEDKSCFPTKRALEDAHETAGPLLAHWYVMRMFFEWTMGVNLIVIILAMGLIPYVPWLARDPVRITATCAFAAIGGVVGMVLSFGLARVLVRTKRITPHDPPTA